MRYQRSNNLGSWRGCRSLLALKWIILVGCCGLVPSLSEPSALAQADGSIATLAKQAKLSISPATLTFGSQTANTTSSAQTVTVQNNGKGPLKISRVQLGGADPNAFAETNTCSAKLDANASCKIQVTFTPNAVASFAAALLISDNGAGSLYSVALSGTGVAAAAPPTVAVIAGCACGGFGFSGDGGPANAAVMNGPTSVAIDASGNIYIADEGNGRIRRVDAATGIITTIAGSGDQSSGCDIGDGSQATAVPLCGPFGVALDTLGNIYIAEQLDIRKVTATTGVISTVAGNGVAGFSGDGGPATSAELYDADGLVVDASGNIYIADGNNGRIRLVTAATGVISTIAGNGFCQITGYDPLLCDPAAVALDPSGNLYVADTGFNNGNTWSGGDDVLTVNTGSGATAVLAGDQLFGYNGDGIPATSADLNHPTGIAVDAAGNVFIADSDNNRIRMVAATSEIVSTILGNGTAGTTLVTDAPTSTELYVPFGVALDTAGNLYVADTLNNRLLKVTGVATPQQ